MRKTIYMAALAAGAAGLWTASAATAFPLGSAATTMRDLSVVTAMKQPIGLPTADPDTCIETMPAFAMTDLAFLAVRLSDRAL